MISLVQIVVHRCYTGDTIRLEAVLKVVQKRSRVSLAIGGRVPTPQNFFLPENGEFWCILSSILCDLELQESKQETGIDTANQRVPGL